MKGKSTIRLLIHRVIRISLWIFGILIGLSVCLSLILMIPPVQKFVVNKAVDFITEKTKMKANIGYVRIGFPKTIRVGKIYLEDQHEDTLLYCQQISVNAALLPLITQKLTIDNLQIQGLKSKISKNTADSAFNFSPLLAAFSGNSNKEKVKQQSNWVVGLDKLQLENIIIEYTDLLDSNLLILNLGKFYISANSMDVSKNKFDLENIDLSNTSLSMLLGNTSKKVTHPTQNTEKQAFPLSVKLEELNVNDIDVNLQFTNGELELSAYIKEATLRPDILDLNIQTITLDELIANTIDVKLAINSSEAGVSTELEAKYEQQPEIPDNTFGDFDWNFFVDHAELRNTSCKMDIGKTPGNPGVMDYSHMAYSDFNVVADSMYFNKHTTGASVQSLSIREASGPMIKDLQGIFSLDNHQIQAKKVALKTAHSEFTGSIGLTYPGLRRIGTELGKLGIESYLQGSLAVSEITPFFTPPESWPDIQKLRNIKVNEWTTRGILGQLEVTSMDISLLSSTHLRTKFGITGLPTTKFTFNYEIDTFSTSQNDILTLVDEFRLPENIRLPHWIGLHSKGWSDLIDGDISVTFNTDVGRLIAKATMENKELSAKAQVDELDLGKILADSLFGLINLESQIQGILDDNSLKSFHSATDIHSFDFNGRTFYDTDVTFNGMNQVYSLDVGLKDSALAANLKAKLVQRDSTDFYHLDLEIVHADLQQLNLMNDFFALSGMVNADLEMRSKDDLKGFVNIENLDLNKENNSFHINSIAYRSIVDKNYSIFNIDSDVLKANLSGNTRLIELKDALIDHLDLYISLPDSIVSEKNFVFDFDLQVKHPQFFTDFLIDGLDEIEVGEFTATYVDSTDMLISNIEIPKIRYNNLLFENLMFIIDSNADSATATFDIGSLTLDTAVIRHIGLKSSFRNQEARASFNIHDIDNKLKYQLIALAAYQDSIYKFSLDPERTIIDYNRWSVPAENSIQIKNGQLSMNSAEIFLENQKIWLESGNNNFTMFFENFAIQNFSSILEVDSSNQIINGDLNGFIEVIDPFGQATVSIELIIPNLVYMKAPLGELKVNLENDQKSPVKFDILLRNNENMIHTLGTLAKAPLDQELHVIFESDISNAASFQVLAPEIITIHQGGIKGRLSIHGKMDNPRINGNLNVNNLFLTLIPTNTLLKNNGQLEIVDNLLSFHSFIIKDSLDQQLAINGNIDFANIKNPNYNMSVKSDDFLLVNKAITEDLPITGKLFLGMDIGITGKQSNLKFNSIFKINEKTNIQYVMPGDELELITDEDVVRYVDFDNMEEEMVADQQEQFIGDSIVSQIKGIDVTTILEINPRATFSVITNPSSGDFTQFQLAGKLEYKHNETQPGFLNGLIIMENGFYELSFYGLVKKRFVYDPGSTVSWSGDVLDGDINFSARHTVRTNSVGLVSNEISSYERAMYNQRIPYDVILKVSDKISSPNISFAIDLPERYRSTYPTLDSKLNIMNQPAMESERNKQVFALLVGGTFIPENPNINEGTSSSNFATTAARNSVNAIMTQQLNQLTGQFIQGFDLDMGINTFEDYGSGKAQTRTQLDVKVSKNLFNDRVTAEMESHIDLDGSVDKMASQSTAGMTEFAVSYKLTEKGNYRIKAFSENAYDIYDGEIQNSGIAFIFVREFDSFGKMGNQTAGPLPSAQENDKQK